MSIDVAGDVREPVADLDAALAVLPKADLQRIERVALLAVGVGHDEPLDRQLVFGSWTSSNGVSAMVLPAYFVSIGFGSKLSTWLTPPFMNSQMTLLALGGKCGWPSGGVQSPSSRASRRGAAWPPAPGKRTRRETCAAWGRSHKARLGDRTSLAPSGRVLAWPGGLIAVYKVVVIHQDPDQVGPGPRLHRCLASLQAVASTRRAPGSSQPPPPRSTPPPAARRRPCARRHGRRSSRPGWRAGG